MQKEKREEERVRRDEEKNEARQQRREGKGNKKLKEHINSIQMQNFYNDRTFVFCYVERQRPYAKFHFYYYNGKQRDLSCSHSILSLWNGLFQIVPSSGWSV